MPAGVNPRHHVTTTLSTSNVLTQIQSPWTTNVVAPPSGFFNVYFVYFFARKATPFTDTATVSGGGLTWTKIFSALAGNDYYGVFMGTGTVTATAVNITFNAIPTGGRVISCEAAILGTSTPTVHAFGATGTGTATAVTVTNPTAIENNAIFMYNHQSNEATTPDTSGWQNVGASQVAVGTFAIDYSIVGASDDSVAASWATSVVWGGVVIALPAAAFTVTKPANSKTDPLSLNRKNVTLPIPLGDGEGPAGEPTGVWAIIG